VKTNLVVVNLLLSGHNSQVSSLFSLSFFFIGFCFHDAMLTFNLSSLFSLHQQATPEFNFDEGYYFPIIKFVK